MLAATACHHSCGSCSDQSGFGVCKVCGEEATATTLPSSSIRSALLDVVEVSMPRKYCPAITFYLAILLKIHIGENSQDQHDCLKDILPSRSYIQHLQAG